MKHKAKIPCCVKDCKSYTTENDMNCTGGFLRALYDCKDYKPDPIEQMFAMQDCIDTHDEIK